MEDLWGKSEVKTVHWEGQCIDSKFTVTAAYNFEEKPTQVSGQKQQSFSIRGRSIL